MNDSERLPFHAQTAILERYLHGDNPKSDSAVIEIIVEMLRENEALSRHFFQSAPNPAWAEILDEHGFFDRAPAPEVDGDRTRLLRWDAQRFLVSVAGQVPDIVLRHIGGLDAHPHYFADAILALCEIPAAAAQSAIPRVIEWIDDVEVVPYMSVEALKLVEALVSKEADDEALAVFQALIAPCPPPAPKKVGEYVINTDAVSRFGFALDAPEVLDKGISLFVPRRNRELVDALQVALDSAGRLEADALGTEHRKSTGTWRSAIEDTDQDLNYRYRDQLLVALRNAVSSLVETSSEVARVLIQDYLNEREDTILRRLALYFVARSPELFQEQVTQQLVDHDNLGDIWIHHEYFLLLKAGFRHLGTTERAALVQRVLMGPQEDMQWLVDRAVAAESDPDDAVARYRDRWIRDRLWMIRGDLSREAEETLEQIVDRIGEPEHPDFLSWTSGCTSVSNVSPTPADELAAMSPDALVAYVSTWTPKAEEQFGSKRTTARGLGMAVADVILENPDVYAAHVLQISLAQPECARAVFDRCNHDRDALKANWPFLLRLGCNLVADESFSGESGYSVLAVKMAVLQLLDVGLAGKEEYRVPKELLGLVKNTLVPLTEDPNPDEESDRPPEGWMGHDDPISVALNRVRPRAVMALIRYARLVAYLRGSEPPCIDDDVREILSRKLDKRADGSIAVHAVFGYCLDSLFLCDREWTDSQLDRIFPEGESSEMRRYFVAAWDAFVHASDYRPDVFVVLIDRFDIAIDNLADGYVTKANTGRQDRLAGHLILDLVEHDYTLGGSDKRSTLLPKFFEVASPEDRGRAAWVAWRICKDNPGRDFWPRMRQLWEYRGKRAADAGHPTDFDEEMQWWGHFPSLVLGRETIASLWPLLEGVLPHIGRFEKADHGWQALEKYVSEEVQRDPVRAIKYYQLMHDRLEEVSHFHPGGETSRILEFGAATEETRSTTLTIIDSLARKGVTKFSYIYDKYGR